VRLSLPFRRPRDLSTSEPDQAIGHTDPSILPTWNSHACTSTRQVCPLQNLIGQNFDPEVRQVVSNNPRSLRCSSRNLKDDCAGTGDISNVMLGLDACLTGVDSDEAESRRSASNGNSEGFFSHELDHVRLIQSHSHLEYAVTLPAPTQVPFRSPSHVTRWEWTGPLASCKNSRKEVGANLPDRMSLALD
jgi:hypothetical protein